MHDALDAQRGKLAIPRRFDATMKELWLLQPRFLQRSGTRPYRLLEHPRFRAAYDFFELRARSGDAPLDVAQWWERFQEVEPQARDGLLAEVGQDGRQEGAGKKRRRRGGRGRRPGGQGDQGAGAPPTEAQP